MTKRVLLCARGFPPLAGPTEYRWLRFVRHLALRGWEVDVLTAQPTARLDGYGENLLKLLPDSVTIHRVWAGPYERWIVPGRERRLRARRARLAARSREAKPSLPDRMYRVLSKVNRALDLFRIPDRTVEWVPFAVRRAAQLLQKRQYDIVVSSSNPLSSHLVGLFVKKRFHLPWVGDISDPYAFSPMFSWPVWRRRVDREIELAYLSAMDAIIMPIQEMIRSYLKRYPSLCPDKVHLIPYGFAEELYESAQPEPSPRFRLVYTGVFYPSIRDPSEFFRALVELRGLQMEVLIAGHLQLEYQKAITLAGLSDMVQHIGFQTREKVVTLQTGATALLLLGNRGGVQLPGKIYDYLAARRPIFMIKNDRWDVAANMVQRMKRGLVVENDPKSIAAGLRQLYALWQADRLDAQFDLGPADEFSWGAQCRKVENLLMAQKAAW